MGCYNYYAVDLGIEGANKKCDSLSKTHNFSDPSFSTCGEFLQPDRANWKAAIADRCIELSKKTDFSSKSFKSCVEHLSIAASSEGFKERKVKIEPATENCIKMNPKINFTSKSFINCFYVHGGNSHPLEKSKAEVSTVIAKNCGEESIQYDFSNDKFKKCWDEKRTTIKDVTALIQECRKN